MANNQVVASELAQARQVLLDHPRVLRRQVNRVAAKGDTDECAAALYPLAAGHKFEYTVADWKKVLDKLDDCTMLVGDWLETLDEQVST